MSETSSSAQERARTRARRRRANSDAGPRTITHKVKVNAAEEAVLVGRAHAAGGVTIPRLLLEAALSDATGETATDRQDRLAWMFRVRQLLAATSNNINQIARATNAGEPIGAELAHTLAKVNGLCDELDEALRAEYAR